jgi:hypothetical protein
MQMMELAAGRKARSNSYCRSQLLLIFEHSSMIHSPDDRLRTDIRLSF